MIWPIKKLRPDAKLPTKAHPGDAGWDFYYCPDDSGLVAPVNMGGFAQYSIPTGLSMAIPEGWCLVWFCRSGFAKNHGVLIHNGVIDSGFRGELFVVLRVPDGGPDIQLEAGTKLAQGLLIPVPFARPTEVFTLPESSRGEQGWGSSGK